MSINNDDNYNSNENKNSNNINNSTNNQGLQIVALNIDDANTNHQDKNLINYPIDNITTEVHVQYQSDNSSNFLSNLKNRIWSNDTPVINRILCLISSFCCLFNIMIISYSLIMKD